MRDWNSNRKTLTTYDRQTHVSTHGPWPAMKIINEKKESKHHLPTYYTHCSKVQRFRSVYIVKWSLQIINKITNGIEKHCCYLKNSSWESWYNCKNKNLLQMKTIWLLTNLIFSWSVVGVYHRWWHVPFTFVSLKYWQFC